jgi:hypothetical protein
MPAPCLVCRALGRGKRRSNSSDVIEASIQPPLALSLSKGASREGFDKLSLNGEGHSARGFDKLSLNG